MVLSRSNRGNWPIVWGICLILVMAGWGLFLGVDIQADPPLGAQDLEGQLLLGARARVPGQDLPLGSWAPQILLPLQTRVLAATFQVFGRDLTTARATSLAGAVIVLLLLYLLILRASGAPTAFLTVVFLTMNPVFFGMARTALPPVLSILFMLLVIWMWIGGARRPWLAYLSGVALVAVGLGENGPVNLFFLLSGILMSIILRFHAWKMAWLPATRRRLRYFWAGCATALIPFVFSVFSHWDEYGVMWRHFAGISIQKVVANLLQSPVAVGGVMQRMPLAVILALAYFLFFAKDVIRPVARHRRLDEVRLWFLCWVLTGIPFFLLGFHHALQDLVLLVPAVCVLAAEAVIRLYTLQQIKRPKLDVMIVLILISSVIWFVSAWLVQYGLTRFDPPGALAVHRLRAAFLATVLLWGGLTYLLGWLYLKLRRFSLISLQHLPVRIVAVTMTVGVLAVGVGNGWYWWSNRTYEVREASAALAALPDDALVAGSWAPLFTLDHEARATIIWPNMNAAPVPWHDEVTHLILQEGREVDPELVPLRLFSGDDGVVREGPPLRIRGHRIQLYRVTRGR